MTIGVSADQSILMQGTLSFNKIINDFYIQVQLNKAAQISFILVQNKRQQCYELKFKSNQMPPQLNLFFRNVNELYDYLFQMQDNRVYFDVSSIGNIRIKKYIKDNANMSFKTIELPTIPVKIKDPNEDFLSLDQQFKINSQTQNNQDMNGLMQRCRNICNSATDMIKNGIGLEQIAQTFRLSRVSVRKMFEQMKRYGRIYPPYRYRQNFNNNSHYSSYEQNDQQPYIQLWEKQAPIGPITSNMKMHGEGVRGIKKLLYVLVKEGKMQSLDEMRNYLLERNIDRSLSSIYRYISSIKAQNPQFQGRNYTMYRKDVEVPEKNQTKKIEEEVK